MAGANLGTVTAYAKLDVTGIHTGAAAARARMATFAREFQSQVRQPLNDMARDASRDMAMVGAATAAGLGLAIKTAAQFDQAMRNVNSIAQVSEKQFQDLKTAVMGLTKDPSIRQGPTDLAKGLYDVYSSGFTGAKAMDILRTSALGASAGMTDTATASRVLMAVLNSGVSGVTSVRQAMDVLFQEVNLGVNNFEGLANALGDVLPTAKTAGVSIQEVSAALAVMTRRGININESVTALNQLLNHLIKPGKEAKDTMDSLGISYGVNAVAAKGLTGVLAEIIEKTHGNKQALTMLVPEVRGMKALLTLTDESGRQYTDMLRGMGHATDGIGMAQKAANEQMKGGAAQFEKLKQQVEATAIQIGTTLLPEVNKLLKWTRDQLDAFNKLPDGTKTAITQITAVGAAAMLAGGFILTLTTRVIELRNALAAAGLLKGLGGLAGGVAGAAALGIGGAVGAGIIEGRRSQEELKAYFEGLKPKKIQSGPRLPGEPEIFDVTTGKVLNPRPFVPTVVKPIGGAAALVDPTKAREVARNRREAEIELLSAMAGARAAERRAQKEADNEYINTVNDGTRTQEEAFRIRAAKYAQAHRDYLQKVTEYRQSLAEKDVTVSAARLDALSYWWEKEREALAQHVDQTGQELKRLHEAYKQAGIDAAYAAAQIRIFQDLQTEQPGISGGALGQRPDVLAGPRDIGSAMEAADVGKILSDSLSKSMKARISEFRSTLHESFSFMPELFANLADEAYGGFAQGLEKIFGKNPFGRALAHTLDRWASQMLDQALASIFTKKTNAPSGGKGGGVGAGIVAGDDFWKVFLPQIPGLGGVLGGILGSLGSIFHFQRGGWVPGPIDAPRPAIVHGGEYVVSRGAMGAGLGGVTINIHPTPGMSEEAIGRAAARHIYRLLPVRPGS